MNNVKPSRTSLYLILFLLIASTSIAYWNIDKCEFISLDDHQYVSKNDHVMSGFNKKNILWAFTTFEAANWHPLTWLSHAFDCTLYGDKPAGHHLTNLMLHIINTLLLFFVLRAMTGSVWRSALVAALFGLHPIHVESVAWVSERKDVLSTLFMFLTMLSYTFFVLQKKCRYYFGALILFALGLLAKPMIVTLPFLLLVLDYWPFGRLQTLPEQNKLAGVSLRKKRLLILIGEKTPFIVLSLASCIITIFAQHAGNAIVKAEELSLLQRFANSVISYASYIGKVFWPVHLSFFYPLPPGLPSAGNLCLAGSMLLVITFFALIIMKKKPYVLAGWLWFLGTLVPVIGIVQVGSQAMADRYTYVPLIGVFIILSWLLGDLASRTRLLKITVITGSFIILFILIFQTRNQVGYWKNDLTLANHALAVTKDNFLAYRIKGNALLEQNIYDEAVFCFRKSLSFMPSQTSPRLNIGLVHLRQKKPREAIAVFNELLAEDSNSTLANLNCGKAYMMLGDTKSAIRCFERAIAKEPFFTAALYNLGITYGAIKDFLKCRDYLLEVVRLNPKDAEAYYSLGKCCYYGNSIEEAIQCYMKSIALDYDFPDSHRKLGEAYNSCGKADLAKKQFAIADSLASCQGIKVKQ
jgi:protein O-mannosyl-transferase